MQRIHSIAVLGAGAMGAQIAAHAANAGVPVLLLDLDSGIARDGLKRARKLRPDPFFTPKTAEHISVGGFDTDLARIGECDWIVEAVVERLDVKQELLARVEPLRAEHAIVSSNTSGIPIASLAAGRGEGFRRHWLGTHFFNPPRYLPLLEIIPTPETDSRVVDAMLRFGDHELGKGVVVAKDTPNFIGNRIGMFGVMRVLEQLVGGTYTIEEIDAMTGPAIGRPRSATFRTLDLAGLDILAHVAANLAERLDDAQERARFALPPLITDMVERGWIGSKAGGGFYRKNKTSDGSEILTLDPLAMDYRPRRSPRLSGLDAASAIDDHAERIRTLFRERDRVGEFLRATLAPTLVYAAEVAPTIAHSIDDVDRAMRWGFGWELGPFEIWDAIGIDTVLEAARRPDPPALVAELKGHAASGAAPATVRFRSGAVPPRTAELQLLRRAREERPPVRRNPGASLVDLGDGVLGLEFHSKMNAIGGDTVAMMNAGVEEASRNFEALVIGNDAPAFSAGANLMLLLLEAQEENWDEIDLMVRTFQSAVLGLRYARVPVVVAPGGLALGGGCEIVLHGDRVQAAAETYMGQVEAGAGLIPAGCGTKELLARFTARAPSAAADMLPYIQQAFELIGFGKVSTSAADARRLGLLRDTDAVTMNRERLIADAKAAALDLARSGYQPPAPRDIAVGGAAVRAALDLGVHLAWRGGRISDYDAHIGRTLSRILAGGDLPHATTVSEQRLLDLEREAFLSLCGQPRTQERIVHVLKTGKPLRN